MKQLKNSKVLVTGGAGFIGSNLIEHFLGNKNEVICLDNLSTGHRKNIVQFLDDPNFQMIEGDIRDLDTCKTAARDCEYIFHEAALGSVPRSIIDPVVTNAVNIDGFLNMLTAARDEGVKRFIYAASSSTYGDSKELPKIEERIGRPLSPYGITKIVNEYFAKVYSEIYGLETIGLRYFNVFGKRQDPNGAYAAVIPIWVKRLMEHESPVINGDGSYSRDFTYIANVVHANEIAATVSSVEILKNLKSYYTLLKDSVNIDIEPSAIVMDIFNVAFGGRTTLLQLFGTLRDQLAQYDPKIGEIEVSTAPARVGDIAHSLASIDKAKLVLGYAPQYDASQGFEAACKWYYESLK
jgi:UDP-N-acetylglucosamine/UDP-N-acetylgalactosamine 4-epimerase